MNFYALLKLHKRIKSPKLKLLGLGLASAVGFRHLSVRLDPTLRCNLACRMCYFSGEGYKAKAGGLIRRDELEGLAKTLFPHAFQLVLGCGAEPTLARHYHEFFRLAKRYGVPDVSMVTNGQLIERDDLEKMADAGVNELILSVHGVREATYESFMPGARYARPLPIRTMRRTKRRAGTQIWGSWFILMCRRVRLRSWASTGGAVLLDSSVGPMPGISVWPMLFGVVPRVRVGWTVL